MKRSGQTVVEYLLITAALVMGFALLYQTLFSALKNHFERGGNVIVKPYVQTYY